MISSSKLAVEVFAVDCRPEITKRAEAMLLTALGDAGVDEGKFQFRVDGACEELVRYSRPHLEVIPSAQLAIMIFVRMKTNGKPDGAIRGMLRLPPAVDRGKLIKDLAPGIANNNEEGWKGVFDLLPPEPPPPGRQASTVKPLEKIVESGSRNPEVAKPIVAEAVTLQSTVVGVAANLVQASETVQVTGQADPYISLLIALLKGKPDGILSKKDVEGCAAQFFPERQPIFLATDVVKTLIKLGYMKRVGYGRFQVEQSFVDKHNLQGITLSVLPVVMRNQGKQKLKKPQPADVAKDAVKQEVGISDLLKQRQAIDEQLRAARKKLATAVETVEGEVKQLEAALLSAKERLSSHLQTLDEFDNVVKTTPESNQ